MDTVACDNAATRDALWLRIRTASTTRGIDILAVLVVLVVALLVLPFVKVVVDNNSAQYLLQAKAVYNGHMPGQLNSISRGPIFPALVAAGYWIFGYGVESAALVVNILFALGVVLVYICGRVLYGMGAGLLAAGLVLSSEEIHTMTRSIDTDIVLPFFMLAFILLFHRSLRRGTRASFLAAGVALGTAVLVKESMLLFLGVPLFVAALGRTEKGMPGVGEALSFLAGVLCLVGPWALYAWLAHGGPLAVLGSASPDVQTGPIVEAGFTGPTAFWSHVLSSGLIDALVRFYNDKLRIIALPIGPVLVLSWLYVAVRGTLQGRPADLIILGSTLCFLPVILITGSMGFRPGQTSVVYYLLYIAVGATLCGVFGFLARLIGAAPGVKRTSGALLAGILLIWLQAGEIDSDRTRDIFHSFLLTGRMDVVGRFTPELREASLWLKDNAPGTSKVVADGYTSEGLNFFDAMPYPVGDVDFAERAFIPFDRQTGPQPARSVPVFFLTYTRFRDSSLKRRLVLHIHEEAILDRLRKERADYLVISHRNIFLGRYFDRVPWARREFANRTVAIYRIDHREIRPAGSGLLCINEWLPGDLEWLREHAPDDYAQVEALAGSMGLDMDTLQGCDCRIPRGESY